jgi:hypothetical protein
MLRHVTALERISGLSLAVATAKAALSTDAVAAYAASKQKAHDPIAPEAITAHVAISALVREIHRLKKAGWHEKTDLIRRHRDRLALFESASGIITSTTTFAQAIAQLEARPRARPP